MNKLTIAKIIIGNNNEIKVILSNGDELVGLKKVETTAQWNDVSIFEIEGYITK